jgi:hypothetical protein
MLPKMGRTVYACSAGHYLLLLAHAQELSVSQQIINELCCGCKLPSGERLATHEVFVPVRPSKVASTVSNFLAQQIFHKLRS